MEAKYKQDGLVVVGVHTPEFDFEKERGRVERAVARYKMNYPILMDNDYGYWKSLENRYWPTFYLVDRKGVIRLVGVGEMHADTVKGDMFEEFIKSLLEEEIAAGA